MHTFIGNELKKTQTLIRDMLENPALIQQVEQIAKRCVATLQAGGKILFAGNGGSAADSQHLAAELVSRFCYNRPALAAIALTTDTSALTAIGNDYAFEDLFSRQIEAIGQKNDLLIGISTSGRSPNILKALMTAKAKGITTVGFTGNNPTAMDPLCDLILHIPAVETAKIQEGHIVIGHIICALIEETIFGHQYNPTRHVATIQ